MGSDDKRRTRDRTRHRASPTESASTEPHSNRTSSRGGSRRGRSRRHISGHSSRARGTGCTRCTFVLLFLTVLSSFGYFQWQLGKTAQNFASDRNEIDHLKDVIEAQSEVMKRFSDSITNSDVVKRVDALENRLNQTASSLTLELNQTETRISNELDDTLATLNRIVTAAQTEIQTEVTHVKEDLDVYARTTQDQFSMENSFMVWQLAGTITLISCLISMWHMTAHLRRFKQPFVQRKIMAILWMAPIYGITSWLSLLFPMVEGYLALMKDFYEAYVIYQFLSFCIAVLGKGDRNVVVDLLTDHADHLDPPLRVFGSCFPVQYESDRAMADAVLLQCQLFTMQFVFFRPLTTIITFACDEAEYYGQGTSGNDFRSPQFLCSMVQNISIFFAFSGLLKFYHAVQDELAWCRPFAKFLCIKGIVFMTFWQGLAISILANTTAIAEPKREGEDPTLWGKQAQNFLICLEMLLFSVAHFYCFPVEEWEEGYRPAVSKKKNFGDHIALGDFLSDLKLILTHNAGGVIRESSSLLNDDIDYLSADEEQGSDSLVNSETDDESFSRPTSIFKRSSSFKRNSSLKHEEDVRQQNSVDTFNDDHSRSVPKEVVKAANRLLSSRVLEHIDVHDDERHIIKFQPQKQAHTELIQPAYQGEGGKEIGQEPDMGSEKKRAIFAKDKNFYSAISSRLFGAKVTNDVDVENPEPNERTSLLGVKSASLDDIEVRGSQGRPALFSALGSIREFGWASLNALKITNSTTSLGIDADSDDQSDILDDQDLLDMSGSGDDNDDDDDDDDDDIESSLNRRNSNEMLPNQIDEIEGDDDDDGDEDKLLPSRTSESRGSDIFYSFSTENDCKSEASPVKIGGVEVPTKQITETEAMVALSLGSGGFSFPDLISEKKNENIEVVIKREKEEESSMGDVNCDENVSGGAAEDHEPEPFTERQTPIDKKVNESQTEVPPSDVSESSNDEIYENQSKDVCNKSDFDETKEDNGKDSSSDDIANLNTSLGDNDVDNHEVSIQVDESETLEVPDGSGGTHPDTSPQTNENGANETSSVQDSDILNETVAATDIASVSDDEVDTFPQTNDDDMVEAERKGDESEASQVSVGNEGTDPDTPQTNEKDVDETSSVQDSDILNATAPTTDIASVLDDEVDTFPQTNDDGVVEAGRKGDDNGDGFPQVNEIDIVDTSSRSENVENETSIVQESEVLDTNNGTDSGDALSQTNQNEILGNSAVKKGECEIKDSIVQDSEISITNVSGTDVADSDENVDDEIDSFSHANEGDLTDVSSRNESDRDDNDKVDGTGEASQLVDESETCEKSDPTDEMASPEEIGAGEIKDGAEEACQDSIPDSSPSHLSQKNLDEPSSFRLDTTASSDADVSEPHSSSSEIVSTRNNARGAALYRAVSSTLFESTESLGEEDPTEAVGLAGEGAAVADESHFT